MRAQLTRKRLHPKLRAAIGVELPDLIAEAQRRGIDLSGWRAYPVEDGLLGTVRVTGTGELVEWLPRGRRRKRVEAPAKSSAGAVLDDLEAALEASLRTVRGGT